jgi:tRNA uridine 5-carbamoylmethylation protein Kti12
VPQVIINVGVPGSGKSTWTDKFIEQCDENGSTVVVCSADKFHEDEFGVYKFDPAKAGMAHALCLNKFLKAIVASSVDFVVVGNTNITAWERMNYVEAACIAKCDVLYNVWPCMTIEQLRICAARNSHGVPLGVIADMACRYESPDRYTCRLFSISE